MNLICPWNDGAPGPTRTADLLDRRQGALPNSLITKTLFSQESSTQVPKTCQWVGKWVGCSHSGIHTSRPFHSTASLALQIRTSSSIAVDIGVASRKRMSPGL